MTEQGPAHSPLPWHIGPHYRGDIESREGRVGCCGTLGSPRSLADAEFIVKACNHHYDLVAVVRQLRGDAREMMALMGGLVEQMASFLPEIPMTERERNETTAMLAVIRERVARAKVQP